MAIEFNPLLEWRNCKVWPEGDPWNDLFALCESPIERRMCVEISERLGYVACAGQISDCHDLEARLMKRGAVVFSQQKIGRYRVDFLIAMAGEGWRAPALVVIECDGYEYHSALEDIWRDEERTEFLASRGLRVIRFSGHDIVRRSSEVMGRIPGSVGAALTDRLWGATQRELYPEEGSNDPSLAC